MKRFVSHSAFLLSLGAALGLNGAAQAQVARYVDNPRLASHVSIRTPVQTAAHADASDADVAELEEQGVLPSGEEIESPTTDAGDSTDPTPVAPSPPEATDEQPSEPSIQTPGAKVHTAEPAPQTFDAEVGHRSTEIIRQRYPNGRIKIEREVTQDEHDNYQNHGLWEMWNDQGSIVARGQYRYGVQHGDWSAWFGRQDSPLLATAPFTEFVAPFVSKAKFVDGKIEGTWVIQDANERTCAEWTFIHGRRDGKSVWFYPTGSKMREIDFRNGIMDGEIVEWAPNGNEMVRERFVDGRRLSNEVTFYPNSRQKKVESGVLRAKLVPQTADNWWELLPSTFVKQGDDERHGTWNVWFANGQMKNTGEYVHDVQYGEFTWWHDNGQKQAEGRFIDGKADGRFTWWHENGVKMRQGEFTNGAPAGKWTQWSIDGKVLSQSEHPTASSTKGATITASATSVRKKIERQVEEEEELLPQESYQQARAPRN